MGGRSGGSGLGFAASFQFQGRSSCEPGGRMIGDPAEHVGEPGLRIDVVEFRRADQGVHRGGPLATTIGAGEQPCAAAERDSAQGALGGVVGQADAAVVEEAGEGRPALEHVIHGLGGLGMARQPGALGAHPSFEVADERHDALLAQLPAGRPAASR